MYLKLSPLIFLLAACSPTSTAPTTKAKLPPPPVSSPSLSESPSSPTASATVPATNEPVSLPPPEASASISPSAKPSTTPSTIASVLPDAITETPKVSFSEVKSVIESNCQKCHSKSPTNGQAFASASIELDTATQIKNKAGRIHARAVVTQSMPPGTKMKSDEIALLKRWFEEGANTDS